MGFSFSFSLGFVSRKFNFFQLIRSRSSNVISTEYAYDDRKWNIFESFGLETLIFTHRSV